MSTDQKHLPSRTPQPPAPSTPSAPVQSRSLDLSVPQIVGGALAAMTTAALGSQLGVAGTLVGAAIASVIAAVATSLYTASLRHTGERLRTVIPAGRSRSGVTLQSGSTASSEAAISAPRGVPTSPALSPASTPPQWRRLNWAGIVVGAVAVFALAAAAVTGIELASGRALSGDEGTTIGQVSDPAPVKADPTIAPAPTVTVTESSEPEPSAPETSAPPQTRPSPTVAAPEPSTSEEPSAPASSAAPRPSASTPAPTTSASPSAAPRASTSADASD